MRYWLYRFVVNAVFIFALVILQRHLDTSNEVTSVLYSGLLFGLLLALVLETGVAIINALLTKTSLTLREQSLSDEKLPDYLGILIQYLIFSKEIERNPSIKTNQRNIITFILSAYGVLLAVGLLVFGIKDNEIRIGVLLSFCWITSYGGAVLLSKKVDERIRRISVK